MKQFMGLILSATLFAGILTGCAKPSADAGQASAPAASDVEVTRMYTDKAGREVRIPARAQRIITVNMTAEAVALGIQPVGAAENWLNSLAPEQKAGIEPVGAVKGLNLEKILELGPDLIITPERVTEEDTWKTLGKIAPTVVGPFFGDAFENLRTMGELLGREEEADAWIAQYEKKAADTKTSLADVIEAGKTALVVQLSSSAKNGAYLYPSSTWPTIYDVLGLTLPDAAELQDVTSGTELSLEKLTEYDPDYIFLTSTDDASMPQLHQQMMENTVWKTLSAVKNECVYTMGARLSAGDVLTLEWALEDVARAVQEAAK